MVSISAPALNHDKLSVRSRVPTNCTFEVDDLEKPWMYKHKFDFINSASLAMGIRDWPRYIKAVYE